MRMASPVMVVAPSTRNSAATATSRGQMPLCSGYSVFAASSRSWYCFSVRILRVPAAEHAAGEGRVARHPGRRAACGGRRKLFVRRFGGGLGLGGAAGGQAANGGEVTMAASPVALRWGAAAFVI